MSRFSGLAVRLFAVLALSCVWSRSQAQCCGYGEDYESRSNWRVTYGPFQPTRGTVREFRFDSDHTEISLLTEPPDPPAPLLYPTNARQEQDISDSMLPPPRRVEIVYDDMSGDIYNLALDGPGRQLYPSPPTRNDYRVLGLDPAGAYIYAKLENYGTGRIIEVRGDIHAQWVLQTAYQTREWLKSVGLQAAPPGPVYDLVYCKIKRDLQPGLHHSARKRRAH